jgi:hypothetical protein
MMFDLQSVLTELRRALAQNEFWKRRLEANQLRDRAVHLAILREPYLRFILEGKKTIESRFAKRACAPFEKISDGDVIVLKRAGGKVLGICLVEKVWFYRMDQKALNFIQAKFGQQICPVDASFWEDRKHATVATLIAISCVTLVEPFTIPKRDRRGWVVLQKSESALLV